MKVCLIWIGRAKQNAYKQLIDDYTARLKHYCKLEVIELKEVKKKKSRQELVKEEATMILGQIKPGDFVILLDERGKAMSSTELAKFIEKRQMHSGQRMVFIIGGPYGFDSSLHEQSNAVFALSKMTFTHDMARLILLEQMYRAFTIIKGEKYHNE